jgi:choline dehydrogenase
VVGAGQHRHGRPNLTVTAGAEVTRLSLRRGRCTGVSYVRDGVVADALAEGEVILAAGAIGSPCLLLRSGIGPASSLPGVGQNLQDHPTAKVCWATPDRHACRRRNSCHTSYIAAGQ